MKLTIERAALLKALAHVQSVVERRNTIPILSKRLITAQKGRLSLAATTWIWRSPRRSRRTPPRPLDTAPAHTLYEIVRKLPDGAQVELETFERRQQPHHPPAARASPAVPAPADFPAMTRATCRTASSCRRPTSRHHRRTRFAISNEETRYYLNGIYFHAAKAGGTECCAASPPTASAGPRGRCRCPRARATFRA